MKGFTLLAAASLLAAPGCRNVEPAPLREGRVAAAQVASAGDQTGFSLYDLDSRWVDQHGDTFTLGQLAGRVRIVALVYTSCHGTCPLIVGEMKRIESALPAAQASGAGFVLVSLDPARDTPGRLAAWAERTRLDPQRWTLLNGDDAVVRELAATLGVRYAVQPDGEVAHANIITVLDHRGRIVHQQSTLGDAPGTARIVNNLLPSSIP